VKHPPPSSNSTTFPSPFASTTPQSATDLIKLLARGLKWLFVEIPAIAYDVLLRLKELFLDIPIMIPIVLFQNLKWFFVTPLIDVFKTLDTLLGSLTDTLFMFFATLLCWIPMFSFYLVVPPSPG
jgi:hypothetical protein